MSASSEDKIASKPNTSCPRQSLNRVLHVEESKECPKFRSVALGSNLKHSPFGAGPVIGLGPPPSTMWRKPSLEMGKSDAMVPVGEKNSTSSDKAGPMWKVTESMVRPLPEDYDVARTSRFVVGKKPVEISMSIALFFKQASIIANYDSKKAKASCTTPDFVKFQVRLHNGRGTFSNGIVVEIQRRRGSSMSFLKVCNLILNAAEGNKEYGKSSAYCSPHIKQPISSMKCLRDAHDLSGSSLVVGVEALTEVEQLLKDKRKDVNVLGMEYLSSLLNRDNTCLKTCIRAALSTIVGTNYPIIHEKVVSYLQVDDGGSKNNDKAESNTSKLRCLALRVIYSCFSLTANNPCPNSPRPLEGFLKMAPWILASLVPLLVQHIQRRSYPHVVLCAAKSLNILITHSKQAKDRALECGASRLLFEQLKQIGATHCASLEDESECILKALR